jgi:hypothetical protein
MEPKRVGQVLILEQPAHRRPIPRQLLPASVVNVPVRALGLLCVRPPR